MTSYLLDVNVVLALVDQLHSHHDLAHRWFRAHPDQQWATCAVTESGVIRILSQPTYGNPLPTPFAAARYLGLFCQHPRHEFWPDDVSLLDPQIFYLSRLPSNRHVTDTYLLGLAASRGGKLATLDRRLMTVAVKNGAKHVEQIV